MPAVSRNFASHFPFTAKLNPLKAKNWPYLFASAAVTRLAVAGARIFENRPENLSKQDMSPSEQKKAFAERCFVEIFGTLTYVTLLQLGQDMAAHVLERIYKPFIPTIRANAIEQLNQNPIFPIKEFTQAFDEVIGTQTKGLLGRVLNQKEVPWTKNLAASNLRSLLERMKTLVPDKLAVPSFEEFMDNGPKALTNDFRFRTNRMLNLMFLFSILFSALVGGFGIQWLNDNVLTKLLKKRYPEQTPGNFLTLSNDVKHPSFAATNPFSQTLGRRVM